MFCTSELAKMIEMRAIELVTEMARESSSTPNYILINLHKLQQNITNSSVTYVMFGGAWCNRMMTKQALCHSTSEAAKQANKELLQ